MADRLPLLNALKVFEAAARHLSFAKAAEELHVTPGAISQQIRNLEQYLGVPLFQRLNRSLKLTRAAEQAAPQLAEAFGHIADVVRQLRPDAEHPVLRVWTPPALGAKWLVPRLARFNKAYPGIDLEISASNSLIGETPAQDSIAEHLRRGDFDIAIAFARGDFPDCRVDKLLAVDAVTLCSPGLRDDAHHPLRTPGDLRHHTLLHDDTHYQGRPQWADWLAVAGIDDVDAARGPRFNQVALALEAAINGQGVLLSMQPLAMHDIAAGRLVVPFELRLPLEYAYYLVSPHDVAERRNVRAFRTWLLQEAAGIAPQRRRQPALST